MSDVGQVVLERMTVEEAGPDPATIAAAIHAQLGRVAGAVPVEAIAAALDIVEIRVARTTGFAGALVTTAERSVGSIAVSAKSGPPRRRFTIAHELGHFLSLHHRPRQADGGFACRREDLGGPWTMKAGDSSHERQEVEANRFAIELLAPARLVQPALRGIPDLEQVIALAARLEISREACARRCCELHPTPTALVFSREGRVRYVERRPEFPFVRLSKGDCSPVLPQATDASGLSVHEEVDPRDWLGRGCQGDLVVQSLHQQGGFAITLLALDNAEDEEDEDD